jgi:hypothetical protein
MIFSLLIIHNHDRMSSITRVLHTATWHFLTSHLSIRFRNSPNVVKEAIMADINDLVQEFWKTSSDGAVGVSLVAMRRLFEILQKCSKVCFNIIFVFVTAVDLADKILQTYLNSSAQSVLIRPKIKSLVDGYRKMFDQSFSKSKDLGDMVRFLPGVVVQKHMSMQGMADLYRIKPDLLKCLIESPIEPLRLEPFVDDYTLDGYLSDFLQDQDRSQLYHCDPMLQHIYLCRHFFSLRDGSNAFDLQS